MEEDTGYSPTQCIHCSKIIRGKPWISVNHDSRIVNSKKIFNNVIFVHKKKNSIKSKINENELSLNEIINTFYKY